jgi:hypothetical protein
VLSEGHARDYASRDFKAHLKAVRKAKPSSVNLSLAAIDDLYCYLRMGGTGARVGGRPAVTSSPVR